MLLPLIGSPLAPVPPLSATPIAMKLGIGPILLAIAVRAVLAQATNLPVSHPGTLVSDFTLQDLSGHTVKYSTLKGDMTVVVFISSRCPISNAFNSRMNALYNELAGRVRFIGVYSNANEFLPEVRHHAEEMGYDFPAYKDLDNVAADALGAQATPETFLIDQRNVVQYHGSIEDSPNPERTKEHLLRDAIQAVLDGRPVPIPETRSLGCVIRRIRPHSK